MLDAFSGGGGMGVGLQRAGWCVTPVDTSKARLAEYPVDCRGVVKRKGDAVRFILEMGHLFAAGHGSPTCTGYSAGTRAIPDRVARYDRLIPAVREAFEVVGLPYTIENVEGARAELRDPILLCGRMFGLGAVDDDGTVLTLDRHRLFESSLPLSAPVHVEHDWRTNRAAGIQVAGVYGGARRDKREAREERHGGYVPPSLEVLRTLLGIDWLDEPGLKLAIPPVYGEYVGHQMLTALDLAAAS